MKNKGVLLSLAVAVMLGMASCNSGSTDSKDSTEAINNEAIDATASTDSMARAQKQDVDDVIEIASAGMMEVELAKIAVNKATSPQVRKFAQMMIDDHTKANDELKSLAESKSIVLPTTLIDKHQKVVNEVSEETGKKFDKKYMDTMVEDHREDVDKFKKIADNANDAEIKAFAAKTLPTLMHHREEAEKLEKITDKM
ncbi:DUF4142 domain-containing protein [Emticicia sp. TH156]|uniref:DUF4142 domain-containing protein n=1 Tax=Emticicia sp. TH156 TaxID=2067454 RepID=UPI000C76CFFF|nr:DUF4142 domain-containing protein [Emticicia sp. TH156]PLK45312.1 DUF305 domain-containing protein [Emticicia sp. TH156]